jgi:hypothetical protein
MPPLVSLLVVSIVTAVGVLVVFARTSDQAGIADAKRGIHAALFEIRLFNDDLRSVARAVGDVLLKNARYLRLSLVPLAWMIVPLTLVVAQLQAFYGYAGLIPGEPALVTVMLRPAASAAGGVSDPIVLDAPHGIRVDTEAVRLAGSNEVLWRVVPDAGGDYALTVRAGASFAAKTVQVSDRPARRSPWRVSAGRLDQLIYPSEPPLPDAGPFESIREAYPEPGVDVLGRRVHWMIV